MKTTAVLIERYKVVRTFSNSKVFKVTLSSVKWKRFYFHMVDMVFI
eukprot:SAG31_NODE_210_length_20286_cov_22.684748_7_plen_46_part_00